jgi:hypothetical protein
MTARSLDGHLGATVAIDVCAACHALWFDQHESLQLTPGATLQLFETIGERAAAPARPLGPVAKCPRCHARLQLTHDMQRNVRFQYLRCPHGHGRLITFYDFLREKNFIRPLSAEQIEQLRRQVRTVNCSNCGGPVDLAQQSSCAHCGSPLSMLDLGQAGALVTVLQQAAERSDRPIDPLLPLRLAQARREVDQAFAGLESQSTWLTQAHAGDLVAATLGVLSRWLSGRA